MKTLKVMVAAVAALAMVSCGNKTTQNAEVADTTSFEQSQIEQKIMVELDSIANLWTGLKQVEGLYNNGKIQLSDEEKKAKPGYILTTKQVTDLSLLSQKYRAFGVYAVDREVAGLYDMDITDLDATMAKLATEIGDPAIGAYSKVESESDIKSFYSAEKEAGRINLFWETSAAAIVENLYVISQNLDKFMPIFDDKLASDFTYQVTLLKLSLDDLATYDDNIKALDEMLAPLNELNAISVDQMKEQLTKMKPQIEAIRGQLLK